MATDLDSELLRTFVTIADSGGFTRAAERVHRTQSAVSMQMKRLEETIGRPLFERNGRGVQLTPEGSTLLGYARRIVGLQQEALTALSQPEMVGSVCVGCPDDYVMRFMPGILARFAAHYPRVQVEVVCESSSRLVKSIADPDSGLDLALVTREVGGVEDGQIVRSEPVVWATSASHVAHELDPLPLALFETGCFFRAWALKKLEQQGRAWRIAYTSPSIAGIQAAVSAGLAVTILARSILPAGVRELTPAEGFEKFPNASIALLRAREPGASPVVDALAGYIAEGFADGEQ